VSSLPQKILDQMKRCGLPETGSCPFQPKIVTNQRGDPIIEKRSPAKGTKSGKKGFVDDQDRIWIRDHAHAGYPEHWDVQIADGDDYFRVDLNGNII
jgi:hypothetical protein